MSTVRIIPGGARPPVQGLKVTTTTAVKQPERKPVFGLPASEPEDTNAEDAMVSNSVLAAAALTAQAQAHIAANGGDAAAAAAATFAAQHDTPAVVTHATHNAVVDFMSDDDDAGDGQGDDAGDDTGGDDQGGDDQGFDMGDALFATPIGTTPPRHTSAVAFDDSEDEEGEEGELAEGGDTLDLPTLVADETGQRSAVLQVYHGNCMRCTGFIPPEHHDALNKKFPLLRFERMKCNPMRKEGGNELCPAQYVRIEVVGPRFTILRRLQRAQKKGAAHFMSVLAELQQPEHDNHREWVLQQAGVLGA